MGGYSFTLFVSPHLRRWGGGGYPGQVQPRGVPQPGLASGVPSRGHLPGVPPSQVRIGGYLGWEVPQPGGAHLGYPFQPGQDGGYPARRVPAGGTPYPGTEQHMEYMIRRGRYAPCVQAGGLSCFFVFT